MGLLIPCKLLLLCHRENENTGLESELIMCCSQQHPPSASHSLDVCLSQTQSKSSPIKMGLGARSIDEPDRAGTQRLTAGAATRQLVGVGAQEARWRRRPLRCRGCHPAAGSSRLLGDGSA